MSPTKNAGCIDVAGKDVFVSGRFPRLAKLHAEHHEYLDSPLEFLTEFKELGVRADIFTFLQPISDPVQKYSYPTQVAPVAVLRIDTFEKWWKQQVNDKTRNMVRKAAKKEVVIRRTVFDDELARGIHAIYNESPLIQGRPSKHYGKDLETLKRTYETFLERSIFIGAYFGNTLIGFVKMILHPGDKSASIMQIISLVAHRDKAPTNGLIGKAVEICAEKGVRHLQYGVWSRRSLGEFKKHHGFERLDLPRYFILLNGRGQLALSLHMHSNPVDLIPGTWRDALIGLRSRWYRYRFRSRIKK